jgi:alpha-D-ribose 1-methylphosphonate 5-triphosphate synthase subunit PhnI
MYVAVKGGEAAIDATHGLIAQERRGDPATPELQTRQIREQMKLAIARVMNEGSLYDEDLAALALKQSQGDSVEAAFLMRAYRTTLPRFGSSQPVDTGAMAIRRRISATFKDLPGGQVLGPTYDYTHRLFDFALEEGSGAEDLTVEVAASALDVASVGVFIEADVSLSADRVARGEEAVEADHPGTEIAEWELDGLGTWESTQLDLVAHFVSADREEGGLDVLWRGHWAVP